MTIVSAHQSARLARAELYVRRTGIEFQNVSRDRVWIEIEVENHGAERSAPTSMRVESAALGAFVPWRPLATLRVPPIPPGGSVRVQTEAEQPRPGPLASFRSFVPPGLSTLVGAGDDRSPRPTSLRSRTRGAVVMLAMLGRTVPGELPPDLLEILNGEQPHWAGNLNVWIERRAVERHMAPRLRVHAGRPNLVMFCVGSGADAYGFRMAGHGADWPCALWDLDWGRSVAWTEESWREPVWHPVQGTQALMLVLRPPQDCQRGVAEVHVTQRSTGDRAIVEFDLDPAAAGPGCYTI